MALGSKIRSRGFDVPVGELQRLARLRIGEAHVLFYVDAVGYSRAWKGSNIWVRFGH